MSAHAHAHASRTSSPSGNPHPGLAAVVFWILPFASQANPQGLVVQQGSASASATGNHLQITASHNAVLQWSSFNLAPGDSASFLQPSASSVVWNRILDANPSQIHGSITANGIVVLMNASGFYFGPGSFVSAAGLVVTTAPTTPIETGGGPFWQFNGAPPSAAIVNYGHLQTSPGGAAFLIAERIENHGSITAPGGSIGLAAGKDVLLSERPDGRGLSAQVQLPSGAIDNSGRLVADAGAVALKARVVNQTGLIQANSVRERNGVIELFSTDIVLGNGGDGSAGSGTVPAGAPPSTLNLDVNTAFTGFSRIVLQATRNITLGTGVLWDLANSTGVSDQGSLLQLEAGNTITLANGSSLLGSGNWSISLQAGRDFATESGIRSGTGSITLTGNATVETASGSIGLIAGQNITVGSGAIRTTAGGSIEARALAGSINTGTRPNGFVFRPSGYSVDPAVGGISTSAGGNVSLNAGLDVTSLLPLPGGTQPNGGSGAFGEQPGNVTVNAGRDVSGHFIARNGTGSINAGRNAGTAGRLLALSLVRGGWSVDAGQDVLLQEIRNPNGVFNNLGSSTSPNRHRFDYAPDAYASLKGGRSVQLRGTALPRYSDVFSQGLPPIYPGRLDISAGAGGVELANDVVLFPSATGNLSITTTDGGSLVGTRSEGLTQLIVSDSGRSQYRAFGDFGIADHAATPVHLANSEPIRIDVAGNVSGILFGLPKRAEIRVGGNAINSRIEGQNLRPEDITRLVVGGDILNRNEFTSAPLANAPDFSAFELGLIYPPPSGSLAGIESRFSYNAANKTLTFRGRMTGDELRFLLNTPVQELDPSGAPILLPNGEPRTRLVPTLPAEIVERLYAESQDVPLNPDTGYRIGGPGRFEITARSLDLGATAGIVSQGPRANAALAQLATRGADVSVTLAGDLDMFSTKIASLNGGSLTLNVGGNLNAGSRNFSSSDSAARGIFTVDASDVTVTARGNINVNGSRIAAYDGGHVTVRSLEGSVDAGTGAGGAATVEKIHVDPLTRRILSYSATIPGSGILATTFPPSLDPAFPPSTTTVGNILVETPRGDIIASAGGVVQVPLNGLGSTAGTVTLRAGSKDASGQVLYRGSIDASGSGVIGSTVKLEASGDIKGLVFARESIDVAAQQNVSVTALAQGNVNVSSGGNISGTIIGVGSVNASGAGNVDATLLSQNISTSGNVTSGQVGFSQGTAANTATQGAQSDTVTKTVASAKSKDAEDSDPRKKTPSPRLTRTVGRVTVILPGKDGATK
jgi:filamentous hemagglutinin family protein